MPGTMLILILSLPLLLQVRGYDLVREYSGISFFDRWTFYDMWDNLTLGDVWWLGRDQAFDQHLAYVNAAGNVILKVDDVSTVPFNEKRNSVRITSNDAYNLGSLWIIDVVHLPYGCSVWPAFWTKGVGQWPDDGEIDIIEGINWQPSNNMALHTTPGCFAQPSPGGQTGIPSTQDCSTPSGCLVIESQPNSYRENLARNGGGVWATQFDVQGIFIWFWERKNIPQSIRNATSVSGISLSDWGPPSAAYPAQGCNITKHFRPQNLVLDITLCGIWAGVPDIYAADCKNSGSTGLCYPDNVPGAGNRFSEAYFEIPYIRAYTTGGVAPTPSAQVALSPPAQTTAIGSQVAGSGNGGRRDGQISSVPGGSTETSGPRLRSSSGSENGSQVAKLDWLLVVATVIMMWTLVMN